MEFVDYDPILDTLIQLIFLSWFVMSVVVETIVAHFYFKKIIHTKKLYLYVLIANLLSVFTLYKLPTRGYLNDFVFWGLTLYLGEFVVYLLLLRKQISEKSKNSMTTRELFWFSVIANTVSLGVIIGTVYLLGLSI